MSFNVIREIKLLRKFPNLVLLYIGYGAKNLIFCKKHDKGADQPVHLCRLVSAFVIGSMESVISKLATCK